MPVMPYDDTVSDLLQRSSGDGVWRPGGAESQSDSQDRVNAAKARQELAKEAAALHRMRLELEAALDEQAFDRDPERCLADARGGKETFDRPGFKALSFALFANDADSRRAVLRTRRVFLLDSSLVTQEETDKARGLEQRLAVTERWSYSTKLVRDPKTNEPLWVLDQRSTARPRAQHTGTTVLGAAAYDDLARECFPHMPVALRNALGLGRFCYLGEAYVRDAA